MILPRSFFQRDTLEAAEELIGCRITSRVGGHLTSGIIVEAEAYLGPRDKAAHSYKGRTDRVRVLYGEKGCAYIYLIYGMYWCLNISAGPENVPECILLRALEPVQGIETMTERRGTCQHLKLCSGPGKLCAALGVTGDIYGTDMCNAASQLFLEKGEHLAVERSRRIGVDYAEEARDFLYRFTAVGNQYLSRK